MSTCESGPARLPYPPLPSSTSSLLLPYLHILLLPYFPLLLDTFLKIDSESLST